MSRIAPPIPNRLDLALSDGLLLRVDFDRAHDRWRHRVLLVVPQGSPIVGPVLLLESIEGNSEEDWPASPPLQFVSIETRPKKPPVALLMGMAGSSHWSASIEQQPAEKSFTFDVACRVKGQPQQLGSRYRLPLRVESVSLVDNCLNFTVAGLNFQLTGGAGKDSPPPKLELEDRELRVHFGEPASVQAQTYRWLYRLQVT